MMLSDLAQQLADQLAAHGDVAVHVAVVTGPGAARTLDVDAVTVTEPPGMGGAARRPAVVEIRTAPITWPIKPTEQ